MKATYFKSARQLRAWLAKNHASATELWVGLHNRASPERGLTYPESLDEALCYGWIDGVRGKVDHHRYQIRFSPRKKGSIWSRVNVGHVKRLIREGRMRAAGLRAYQARTKGRTGIYSFEARPRRFPRKLELAFRASPKAWSHWSAQPPGYRRSATWWVVSAVREETRSRRLAELILVCEEGVRLGLLT